MKTKTIKFLSAFFVLAILGGSILGNIKFTFAAEDDFPNFNDYTVPAPTVRVVQAGSTNSTVAAQVFWEIPADAEPDAYGFKLNKKCSKGEEQAANYYPAETGFDDLTDSGFYYDEAVPIGETCTYSVQTYDRAGKESEVASAQIEFKGIEVKNIAVSDITESSAKISWDTDEPTFGKVEYGPTTSYGQTSSETDNSGKHSVALTGLTAGAALHFRIKAYMFEAENEAVFSEDQSFTTTSTTKPSIDVLSSFTHVSFSTPTKPAPDNIPNQLRIDIDPVKTQFDISHVEIEIELLDNVIDATGQHYVTIYKKVAGGVDRPANPTTVSTARVGGVVEPTGDLVAFWRIQSLSLRSGDTVVRDPNDIPSWRAINDSDTTGDNLSYSTQQSWNNGTIQFPGDAGYTIPLWSTTYFPYLPTMYSRWYINDIITSADYSGSPPPKFESSIFRNYRADVEALGREKVRGATFNAIDLNWVDGFDINSYYYPNCHIGNTWSGLVSSPYNSHRYYIVSGGYYGSRPCESPLNGFRLDPRW